MKSLRVQVDQDRVRQLGVSSKSLAEALNAVTSGMVVTEVRDSIYLTDLAVRATEEQRASLQTLKNLQVALDNGQTIPLSQVASVQYALEPPVIWRRNLLPTVIVQADVLPGIEAKTVNKQLAPALAQLAEKLPEGYTIEAGGTIEESAKGLNSIVAVFPVMIMLMLIILMVQLQSFQKMFLVISVAPLGSSSGRWADLVNDLQSDPVIREHFQFWWFSYSTGNPRRFLLCDCGRRSKMPSTSSTRTAKTRRSRKSF
jgi:multidrug efflux pump subunit AcrB